MTIRMELRTSGSNNPKRLNCYYSISFFQVTKVLEVVVEFLILSFIIILMTLAHLSSGYEYLE